jgi:hypothetical protein
MPFRTKEVLESWLEEFSAATGDQADEAEVLRLDADSDDDGDETGLVVIRLHNATTDVYMQPAAPGDPGWEVTFAARDRDLALTPEGVAALAAELQRVAVLCRFMEQKSRDHVAAAAG